MRLRSPVTPVGFCVRFMWRIPVRTCPRSVLVRVFAWSDCSPLSTDIPAGCYVGGRRSVRVADACIAVLLVIRDSLSLVILGRARDPSASVPRGLASGTARSSEVFKTMEIAGGCGSRIHGVRGV